MARHYKNSPYHRLRGCVYAPDWVHNVRPGVNLDDDGVGVDPGLEDEELLLHSYRTLLRVLPTKLIYAMLRQYSLAHFNPAYACR